MTDLKTRIVRMIEATVSVDYQTGKPGQNRRGIEQF